ncbi:MAG: ABC transporter permease [Aristaeellaceae bacterium]
MIAVFQKEVSAYYKGIMGYLFAAFLLVVAGVYTMAYNLSGYYANFEYVLSAISFVYLIIVPILTMRSVAEEKRQKTDQLLYALPMRLSDVILGKYLAMLVVLAVPTAIMGLYPLILSQFGTLSLRVAYGSLLGFYLLGASLLAMGLFISSVTESQVASAVLTLVVALAFYLMSGLASFVSTSSGASLMALCVVVMALAAVLYVLTKNPLVSLLVGVLGVGGLYLWYALDSGAFSGLFSRIMEQLSLFDRFYTFVEGVFDLTAIVYYLSIICVFLFLAVQALEKRRWSE